MPHDLVNLDARPCHNLHVPAGWEWIGTQIKAQVGPCFWWSISPKASWYWPIKTLNTQGFVKQFTNTSPIRYQQPDSEQFQILISDSSLLYMLLLYFETYSLLFSFKYHFHIYIPDRWQNIPCIRCHINRFWPCQSCRLLHLRCLFAEIKAYLQRANTNSSPWKCRICSCRICLFDCLGNFAAMAKPSVFGQGHNLRCQKLSIRYASALKS